MMTDNKRLIGFVVVVVALACFVACFSTFLSTPLGENKEELKIGFSMPLSGKYGGTGRYSLEAIKLWAEEVNKEGGIYVEEYGKRLKVNLTCSPKPEKVAVIYESREFPRSCAEAAVKRAEERGMEVVLNVDYPKGAEEELQRYNAKLKRFNRLAVGRESKMIELKKELNRLYERLGEEPQYRIASEDSHKITNEELRITGGEKGIK